MTRPTRTETINEAFRQRLIALRDARGLSAAELSDAVGLNRRAVQDIEEGRAQSPKLSTVAAQARALRVPLAELIGAPSDPREAVPRILPELAAFFARHDEAEQLRLLDLL